MLKRTEFKGTWGLKGPIGILVIYFCVLFPALHILFPQAQKWSTTIYPAYFGMIVVFFTVTRRATWQQLGFHKEHWKQNLILGCITGALVVGAIPLLDFFVGVSGLGQNELFAGAEQRLSEMTEEKLSFLVFIAMTSLVSFAEQGFLTAYVLQALIRKRKPVLAIYIGALIFTLVHFDLQLGMFLLGLIASSFYMLTGSLVAPLIFQVACHTAGWLLTHHYPKVFTLLGFLF